MGRQIDLHAGGTRSFFSATMSPFCLSQDILDAWLRCQESWLYLEPIFNSEDIMKQMPVEGRKFNKVDRIWRNIMAKTVSDTRVLQATSQPNMLVSFSSVQLQHFEFDHYRHAYRFQYPIPFNTDILPSIVLTRI